MTTEELEVWKALNELPEVKAVFVRPEDGDLVIYQGNTITFNRETMWAPRDFIWAIPLYDPVYPERSLWGIFKRIVLEINAEWENNTISLNEWSNQHIGFTIGRDGTDRPDLALAKAIVEA